MPKASFRSRALTRPVRNIACFDWPASGHAPSKWARRIETPCPNARRTIGNRKLCGVKAGPWFRCVSGNARANRRRTIGNLARLSWQWALPRQETAGPKGFRACAELTRFRLQQACPAAAKKDGRFSGGSLARMSPSHQMQSRADQSGKGGSESPQVRTSRVAAGPAMGRPKPGAWRPFAPAVLPIKSGPSTPPSPRSWPVCRAPPRS